MKDKKVKKMAELLQTDINGIIPGLEKLMNELKEQEKEIKKVEEKIHSD